MFDCCLEETVLEERCLIAVLDGDNYLADSDSAYLAHSADDAHPADAAHPAAAAAAAAMELRSLSSLELWPTGSASVTRC